MADDTIKAGDIQWVDLTVENAESVRDFYHSVVGWNPEPVDMNGYHDFNMIKPGNQTPTAGICHARGINKDLPPQWLIYITVSNLDESIASCRKLGGKVVAGPSTAGAYGRYCVIQDPAGAHAALFQPAQP